MPNNGRLSYYRKFCLLELHFDSACICVRTGGYNIYRVREALISWFIVSCRRCRNVETLAQVQLWVIQTINLVCIRKNVGIKFFKKIWSYSMPAQIECILTCWMLNLSTKILIYSTNSTGTGARAGSREKVPGAASKQDGSETLPARLLSTTKGE